jgi:ankyrin repeat protein
MRRGEFFSPVIELMTLRRQLKEFAEMPDEDAANVCVFFGGSPDWTKFQQRLEDNPRHQHSGDHVEGRDDRYHNARVGHVSDRGGYGADCGTHEDRGDADIEADDVDMEDHVVHVEDDYIDIRTEDMDFEKDSFAGLRQFAEFAPNRSADFEVTDSDAYDLTFVSSSPLSRSNFYNQLETFMKLASESGMKAQDERSRTQMAEAIFHGSLDIVRYLTLHYGIQPNDEWDNMSYINHAIVFRRTAVVKFFLQHGAVLEAAVGNKPSGLHLVSRHDDPDLTKILCRHLKTQGKLTGILESATTAGPLKGWTVAYTAMACQAWQNLEILLENGADPNSTSADSGPSLLELAVKPQSPAVPRCVLRLLLQKGAVLDDGSHYDGSPLSWTIGSSNVLAVLDLLLHSAVVSDAAVRDAEEDVHENEQIQMSRQNLPVLDEDAQECEQGWENMIAAARLIKRLLYIAQCRHKSEATQKNGAEGPEGSWKQKLVDEVQAADEACKSKM